MNFFGLLKDIQRIISDRDLAEDVKPAFRSDAVAYASVFFRKSSVLSTRLRRMNELTFKNYSNWSALLYRAKKRATARSATVESLRT